MPDPLSAADVERVLVVVAHPDDADFGAAGTTATWTRAGVEVTYLLCTYGDQGVASTTPRASRCPSSVKPSSAQQPLRWECPASAS